MTEPGPRVSGASFQQAFWWMQRGPGQLKYGTGQGYLDAQGALGTNRESLKLDFREGLAIVMWV